MKGEGVLHACVRCNLITAERLAHGFIVTSDARKFSTRNGLRVLDQPFRIKRRYQQGSLYYRRALYSEDNKRLLLACLLEDSSEISWKVSYRVILVQTVEGLLSWVDRFASSINRHTGRHKFAWNRGAGPTFVQFRKYIKVFSFVCLLALDGSTFSFWRRPLRRK